MAKKLQVFSNIDNVDLSSALSDSDITGLARMFLDIMRRKRAQNQEAESKSA